MHNMEIFYYMCTKFSSVEPLNEMEFSGVSVRVSAKESSKLISALERVGSELTLSRGIWKSLCKDGVLYVMCLIYNNAI